MKISERISECVADNGGITARWASSLRPLLRLKGDRVKLISTLIALHRSLTIRYVTWRLRQTELPSAHFAFSLTRIVELWLDGASGMLLSSYLLAGYYVRAKVVLIF